MRWQFDLGERAVLREQLSDAPRLRHCELDFGQVHVLFVSQLRLLEAIWKLTDFGSIERWYVIVATQAVLVIITTQDSREVVLIIITTQGSIETVILILAVVLCRAHEILLVLVWRGLGLTRATCRCFRFALRHLS